MSGWDLFQICPEAFGGWFVQVFQIWLIAFLTLALFSFMYRDNPIYRIVEHIFAGLTAGYQVGLIWETIILQQLWDPMIGGHATLTFCSVLAGDTGALWNPEVAGKWWLFLPGLLGFLMFARFSGKYSWVSRTSLAFVMGTTAGIFLISELHGRVLPQMQDTMVPSSVKIRDYKDDYENNKAELHGLMIEFDTAIDAADSSKSDSLFSFAILPDTVTTTTSTNDQADTAAVIDNKDTTLQTVESLGLATDSLSLLAVGIDSLAVVTPIVDQEDTYPKISAGITTARIEQNPDGADTVYLTAEFKDTLELGFGEFYAMEFKIRNQESLATFELAKSTVYGSDGITLTDNGAGVYLAEYRFVPRFIDNYEIGDYDLSFAVERRSVNFLLTIIVIAGVLSTLVYFYFSKEHVGVLGSTARVGIWFIMISFGAHFGYTVMGRISLLIGRMQFLIEEWINGFPYV